MATTDKQKDHFANYLNPEVISGNGTLGNARVVAQLRRGKRWAVWEAASLWGGRIAKGHRLRDHNGALLSWATKEEAVEYSERIR